MLLILLIQGIGHPSTYSVLQTLPGNRHKTTRHTPPGRNHDLTSCGGFLDFMFACRLTNFLLLQNLRNYELSGDGGI